MNETTELLREILAELKKQSALSEAIATLNHPAVFWTRQEKLQNIRNMVTEFYASQETHSPAPSSNTAAEGLAESDNRCTATVSSDQCQKESSPATSAETLSAMSGESTRNSTGQSSVPEHPLEKPFWESIVSTSRLTSREEVYSLVQEALQAIAKRLAESRLQQCYY